MSNQTRKMLKAADKLMPCIECGNIKQVECFKSNKYSSCKAINKWEFNKRQEERRKKYKCCGVPMLYKQSYGIYICNVCGKEKKVV